MTTIAEDVTGYWRHAGPGKWYTKNARFDQALRLRFEAVHHAAARGEFDGWMGSADGSLALLILLDQIPRNLFRGSAHAFATDPKARLVARNAVLNDYDKQIEPALVQFMYMPFEHSEDPVDQDLAVKLFTALPPAVEGEDPAKWAKIHKEIIDRFGRFPHRNAALGRETTPEEQQFLDDGGFAG
jgi:uncharacterized protein (DUF924 family)